MVDNQTNIFEMLYPTFKIDKPIRTIELFGGYGSQLLSLKYLNADVEQWKLCEWAIKSIQAYKDIHFEEDDFDYSEELSLEEVKKYLLEKGISSNYNEPMTQQQINRLNDKQARTIYNNIQATHNLVNIQQVKGKDLEIIDKDKYTYIMTYSFPCQDLSLAGKGKGMSDTSTRSGMLWEVERILTECKEKPQILLMENVPQVHGQDNIADFNKWQYSLEKMGYKNYWKDLIATDYGIPQTRNRCFMISILGDYNYTFPKPISLKLKLKDMLEDNVDEKYFLSDKQLASLESGSYNASKPSIKLEITDKGLCQTLDTMSGENRQPLVRVQEKYYLSNKMIDYITSKDDKYKVNENKLVINRDIACSKTTREGNTRADTSNYICRELPENTNILKIKNKSLQETLEQNEIDDTCYIDTYNKRIDKEKTGTITTGVSFRNNTFLAIKEYIGTYQYSKSDNFMKGKDSLQLGKETSDTLQTTPKEGVVNSNLRIRKLTPYECFALMGVKKEDYEKIAKNQSDSSLYHLAGDSIVVNVLMAIFKELL